MTRKTRPQTEIMGDMGRRARNKRYRERVRIALHQRAS